MTLQAFKDSVQRYVRDRVAPGEFVQAVLANDLRGAFHHADVDSRERLKEFVSYVYWEVPSNLCGSYAAVAKHLEVEEAQLD